MVIMKRISNLAGERKGSPEKVDQYLSFRVAVSRRRLNYLSSYSKVKS